MMLYSCTHTATVGIKGLNCLSHSNLQNFALSDKFPQKTGALQLDISPVLRDLYSQQTLLIHTETDTEPSYPDDVGFFNPTRNSIKSGAETLDLVNTQLSW